MNNLADLTEKLRLKDLEKATIEQEIEDINGYQDEGFIGKVRIHFLRSSPHDVTNIPVSLVLSVAEHDQELLSVSSVLIQNDGFGEMMIKKRDIDVIVTLKEETTNEPSTLTTSFNTSEIPDDISSKFDLEMSNESVNATVTLMASFDLLDDLLQSKHLQLSQAVETLEALRHSVSEASKKKDTDPGVGKKNKKGTKSSKEKKVKRKTVVDDVDLTDVDDFKPMDRSYTEVAMQSVSSLLQLAIEKRGYAIFCIAAAGIYYFGDYASV